MPGPEFQPSTFIPQEELFIESESDRIQSNCGLFAAIDVSSSFSGSELKEMTLLAGASLQHRAEGAAGYTVFDSIGQPESVKGFDTIAVAFQNGRLLPSVPDARITLLHTRYPTSGDSKHIPNIQPLSLNGITLAHHGNLTNAVEIKNKLEQIEWGGLYPNNDSWVALNAISQAEGETLEEKMLNAQKDFKGGWAFIATDGEGLVASRDPEGIRPLSLGVIGTWDNPQAFALSVETSAFKANGITEYREVLPGESISIREDKLKTIDLSPASEQRSCIFEFVYMMWPNSEFLGQKIYAVRRRAGEILWEEHPVYVDDGDQIVVMPVPDSGRPAAQGYFNAASAELGDRVRYEEGIIAKKYVGRTFIQPTGKRSPSVKYDVLPEVVKDRRVVVLDDSGVRGTTERGLAIMLRNAGATEVDWRNASPEVQHPCFWGIAMETYEELIAHNYPDRKERVKVLGVDSSEHLSLEGTFAALEIDGKELREKTCAYCFGGNGPKYIPNKDRAGTIELIEQNLLEIS